MTFREFIALKTHPRFAAKLNVPLTTTYQWSSRGQVPRGAWPDILLAYPEVGLSDLLEMERASTERV